MEFTNHREELTEACHAFQSAAVEERELAQQSERMLGEFGRSRSTQVALQCRLVSLRGHHASEALLENPHAVIETVRARQKELDTLHLQCEMFARALDDVRHRRTQAAEATAQAFRTLRKHALELLETRYGKRRRFSWWTDEQEQTYVWRRSVLLHLLALASREAERACGLLQCFFQENADFALHVRRGFRIVGEAGMRDIRPAELCIPKDLSVREAFESVLAGRAELVAA